MRILKFSCRFACINQKELIMKIFVKSLKKGDNFKFNDTLYIVKQRFSKWEKNDDEYLMTVCGEKFYYDNLEINLIF